MRLRSYSVNLYTTELYRIELDTKHEREAGVLRTLLLLHFFSHQSTFK